MAMKVMSQVEHRVFRAAADGVGEKQLARVTEKRSCSKQLQKMVSCRTSVPSPINDGCVDLGLVIPESRCQIHRRLGLRAREWQDYLTGRCDLQGAK